MKFHFWDLKGTCVAESESKATSRYILDNSGVFPTHVSYIEALFQRKIIKNQKNRQTWY